MKKKRFFGIAATAVLCILLNIGGHIFTLICPVPFWLDTVGTMISACLCGPIIGGAVGFLSNLISRLCFVGAPIIFSLINIMIGVTVGIIYRKGLCSSLFGALCTGILMGVVTVACAVPVNMILFDGRTNNIWGAALFDMLSQYRIGTVVKAVLSQMFIDIPDKVLSMALAYLAVKLLRKKLSDENGNEVEDEKAD
ncbi:MAG: ECF transporter S component [Oscillospiraceae bacterium]